MNDIKFIRCNFEEIQHLVENYVRVNNITVDSYWEQHVIESSHYKIVANGEIIGFFAIHKEHTITLFYVSEFFANHAQELFAKVKKYEQVKNAMVPTGDEFFLSHCIDNFARLEKEAYFSIYTEKQVQKELKKELILKLADIDKDLEILKLSGDFFDDSIEIIKNNGEHYHHVYIAYHESVLIGFGVIEYGRIVKDIASIGMYVLEEYRQKGFAGNILEHLKNIALEKNCRVFSGCWYYNHNSKKSMESAGAYSKTRLVKFYF
ncbi:MAG: GNAT family N-acetyltransferase [Defluviitaleaceae bacterium]|nr:GNAT family N-acetyltransferase [Defluviitaleaceae bacterium]